MTVRSISLPSHLTSQETKKRKREDSPDPRIRSTSCFTNQSYTATFPSDQFIVKVCFDQMVETQRQAMRDHGLNPTLISIEKLYPPSEPCLLDITYCTEKGPRPFNEDAHHISETDQGHFLGVFDGHGADPFKHYVDKQQPGQIASSIAASSIQNILVSLIKTHAPNISRAFHLWSEKVHQLIPRNICGTTAAVCFIDKKSYYIYAATIGDTEIGIFRKIEGQVQFIALSPVINWCTPKASQKVKAILEPDLAEKWEAELRAKYRHFPPFQLTKQLTGVNTAVSLGDHLMTYKGQTAVSHKPECSVMQLQVDDLVLIACDGVFDYVPLQELTELVQKHWDHPGVDFAQVISNYAIHTKKGRDNVTVIAARVCLEDQDDSIYSKSTVEELDSTSPPTRPVSPELIENDSE